MISCIFKPSEYSQYHAQFLATEHYSREKIEVQDITTLQPTAEQCHKLAANKLGNYDINERIQVNCT